MIERFLTTGPRGLTLCVCEWGDPRGAPILVLHGFLEQGAAWDAVARHLPGRVVAPDHRGHGRSDHVGRGGFYHFWDYVPDVDAVVDDLGGRVDLVGHSMGGTIACLFAATRPDKVRRLVLVEGLGPPDADHEAVSRPGRFVDAVRTPPRHRVLANVAEAAERMRAWNPHLDERTALRLATRATRPLSADERAARGASPRAVTWRWDALHRARNPTPFRAHEFRRFLERIVAPTLLVRGATSRLVPSDLDARAAAIQRRAERVLPGGHMLHHECPDRLADAITEWFAASD